MSASCYQITGKYKKWRTTFGRLAAAIGCSQVPSFVLCSSKSESCPERAVCMILFQRNNEMRTCRNIKNTPLSLLMAHSIGNSGRCFDHIFSHRVVWNIWRQRFQRVVENNRNRAETAQNNRKSFKKCFNSYLGAGCREFESPHSD